MPFKIQMIDATRDMISTSKKEKRPRDSNIELFWIVVMLLIIAHHYCNGEFFEELWSMPVTASTAFAVIFGAWGKAGINCFVLITGWFMCTSRISAGKFLKLFLAWKFYGYVFYLLDCIVGADRFRWSHLVFLARPPLYFGDHFIDCYLVFFLFIPFLNALIQNLDERMHLRLVLLCLALFTFLGSTPYSCLPMCYVFWFMVIYLVGAYLRLHEPSMAKHPRLIVLGLMASIAISCASILLRLYRLPHLPWGGNGIWYFVADSNKILAVVVAVLAFLFFKNLHLRNFPIINAIAATTFGVLLIHTQPFMRRLLWEQLFRNVEACHSPYFPLFAIGAVILTFIGCSCIDTLRIHFLEKPLFNVLSRHFKLG